MNAARNADRAAETLQEIQEMTKSAGTQKAIIDSLRSRLEGHSVPSMAKNRAP